MHLLNSSLSNIASPPKQLFIKGVVDERIRIAIVGSRKASREGEAIARDFSFYLAERGIAIVSGLAYGIDTAAHRGAISANGPTIAVLPCGIDSVYPAQNYSLAQQIVEKGGALISEYRGNYRPKAYDFLARNRLIAGLSRAVVIVEAGKRSGALNTAHHALESGIEVVAVPGSINSPLSVGTNNLIKMGAHPLTKFSDLLEILGLEEKFKQLSLRPAYNKEEARLVKLLGAQTLAIEQLAIDLDVDIKLVQAMVSKLEIEGAVRRLPGNVISLRKQ